MYVQRHIPLLKILIPFIGGILLCSKSPDLIIAIEVVFPLIMLLIIAAHYYLKRNINPKLQLFISMGLLLEVVFLGFLISYHSASKNSLLHFANQGNVSNAIVKITSSPTLKPNSVACEVDFLVLWDSSGKRGCKGKAQLYFQNDSNSLALSYGDLLALQKEIKSVESPSNPHQFNFNKYYASRGIYHSDYIESSAWIPINLNQANWLYELSFTIQDKLKRKFTQYFKDESVRGVAEAIVFGYKEELDDQWMEAFSKTGTIHVLAVSGLHVGIIYVLISFLLGLSKSNRKLIAWKTLFVILVLFLYCLVTGFSPSVTRASLMFGLVMLANLWQRQSNIYNTLCFACLVLLIANPNNIYNVGFQFSFLAVLGIVFYKDYFRKAIPTSNFVLSKVVMLGAVSIAAQIATFPLGIYYFHQYPNLFIFSNLIVIPCISIILYAGIFFILFSFVFPPLASLLALIMEAYIHFISSAVLFIQEVPFAFFEDIHISFNQLLLIYCFIISLTYGVLKRAKYAFALPITICMLFMWVDYSIEKDKARTEVVYFKDKNELVLGFRNNDSILIIASKGAYANSTNYQYVLRPYLVNERLINSYEILPVEITRFKSDLGIIKTLANGNVWFNNKSYFLADYNLSYILDTIHVNQIIINEQRKLSGYNKAVSRLVLTDSASKIQ